MYICHHCNFRKNRLSRLKSHIKTKHVPNLESSYNVLKNVMKLQYCLLCQYKTECFKNLLSHVILQHANSYSSQCPLCEFKTKLSSCLSTHFALEHISEQLTKCPMCGFKLETYYDLLFHLTFNHTNECFFYLLSLWQ